MVPNWSSTDAQIQQLQPGGKMKSKEDRICELRVFLKKLEEYRQWCIDAGDAMREENTCLAISETREEIRALSA